MLGDCVYQIAQGTSVLKYPVPISPYVPSYFLDQPGRAPEDMEPSLSVYIHLRIKQVSLTSYAHQCIGKANTISALKELRKVAKTNL